MGSPVSVVVIGAGICGLATAIACRTAGAEVKVLEATPALTPLGTAISLWPNALSCLEAWGMADDIGALGYPFDRVTTRKIDGTAILRFDLGGLHEKYSQHSRCVTRADLHAALAARLPDGVIRLGVQADRIRWNDTKATVSVGGTITETADLVVVADGQNSTLRTQILGDSALRPAGYGAILGLAQGWTTPPGWGDAPEACEYYGPNGRFGVFRSGQDQTYWFFVSRAVPSGPQAQPADRAWITSQLAQWPAYFQGLVGRTPQDRMPQVAFHDRAPAPHWGNGRVLLAGDAAHPMLPNFGQGANQAIEDAYAIGLGLQQGKQDAPLEQFYTAMRKRRAERLVAQNRQTGRLVQQENRVGQILRNALLRSTPNWALHAQFDRQFKIDTP